MVDVHPRVPLIIFCYRGSVLLYLFTCIEDTDQGACLWGCMYATAIGHLCKNATAWIHYGPKADKYVENAEKSDYIAISAFSLFIC